MTAPAIAPTMPRNDLAARLQYQCACNRLMLDAGYPAPVFTLPEFQAMAHAYEQGITPAVFVETVRTIRSRQ